MRQFLIINVLSVCWAYGCSTAPAPEPTAQQKATVSVTDASVRPVADVSINVEVFRPPERVRSVYPEAQQTKRAWAKRMLLERRFAKEICAPDMYLVNCISAFRNPETRVLGRFGKKDCMDAVDNIVGKELKVGGKSKGLTGSFYAEDLPPKLKAGREMDLVADRLGRRVLSVLLPAMRKHGARFVNSPRCMALRGIAGRVDGN